MLIQAVIKKYPLIHRQMVDAAVQVLNEALAADPRAINLLFSREAKVNTDELREHPTIQVGDRDPFPGYYGDKTIVVRPLGLINGLFGADEKSWGYIAIWTKQKPTVDDWIDYFYARSPEGKSE